ncbi:hypothetical protein BGX33_012377 [Mortierella sp. NVP41]|nr:hypothetical protein BGX33_012377 [Mortierella sp. NVP41]
MAALFRNSNSVRLSLITDAFSRLRSQPTGSFVIPQHSTYLRFFSHTRPVLLKNLAGTDNTTTLDHNLSSPKRSKYDGAFPKVTQLSIPPQSSRTGEKKIRTQRKSMSPGVSWTEEDDRELFRLVKEGKDSFDIWENHFRRRSHGAITMRMVLALKAAKLQEEQARRGVLKGEVDVARAVTEGGGEDGEGTMLPLRAVYTHIRKAEAERRYTDKSDGAILRSDLLTEGRLGRPPRNRIWTPEEDEVLERLVRKFIDTPQPTLWHKITGGDVEQSLRLSRSAAACNRRWRQLYPSPSIQSGRWSKEEERRFQEAISKQLEGKYQVGVDIVAEKYSTQGAQGKSLGKWRPDLQQLPSQSSLPILKLGSRRLRMLNWIMISEAVKSRGEDECRKHFYRVYHNADRGPWSEEELKRVQEGLEMFGKVTWKIAEHVGTRSPTQVYQMLIRRFKNRNEKPLRREE